MRNFYKPIIALLILLFLWTGSALAYTIDDSYIGDDAHGYGDVIGNTGDFEISSAEVTLSGTILTIEIYTTFAGKADQKLFPYNTGGLGIGYGDLFLTTDYDTSPDEATIWEYVFSLDNRWSDDGSGYLYALDGTDDILESGDFLSGAIFRDGQEVAINSDGQTVTKLLAGSFSSGSGVITFTFDISGTTLVDADSIGIHWGMTCANDVIEGAAAIPEPATLMLLGTGLLGIGLITKRKIQK